MFDPLIEERRKFLDLILLIAAVSVLTAWFASEVRTWPWYWQAITLGLVVVLAGVYVWNTPLFSFDQSKLLELMLSYDSEADSFLLPIGSVEDDIARPISQVWHHSTQREQSSEDEAENPFEDDVTVLYELTVCGILGIWSRRYAKSWDVETKTWAGGRGQVRRSEDRESTPISSETLQSVFKRNRFFQAESGGHEKGTPQSAASAAWETDQEGVVFHLPPKTVIRDRSGEDGHGSLSIELENPYIRVQIQAAGYSGGMGHPAVEKPNINRLQQASEEEREALVKTMMEIQRRFRRGHIQLTAVLKPKKRRVLGPDAPAYWNWAKDLVDSIEAAGDYPVDDLHPVNYE